MSFTRFSISGPLHEALTAQGFAEPTPIQSEAIPPALQAKDIVGCAQTGTGKTLAFLLPACERLLSDARAPKDPRVLILEPTRELVIQVTDEARKLVKRTPIRVVAVYGGAQMRRQTERLRRGVDVVIATPGRLMDHMRRRNVNLGSVEVLILDEADRMLDMGFLPDIKHIVSRVPRERQTMLFSATMPPAISALARHYQRDPVSIEIAPARPPEAIHQALYPVPKHLKTDLLVAMLEHLRIESMLVFTRTKQEADILTRHLKQAGIAAGCIHGDFSQSDRLAALEGFRSGKARVLVATNIAARGWDVEGISHVVNFDVPDQAEDYVHRVGRTGRAEAEGVAFTFVTPDDEGLVARIEHLLAYKIERRTLPGFNYDVPAPSWAKPSAEALMRQISQPRNLADRWRAMC